MGLVQMASGAVGPWVKKVQKSAAKHGGGCTYVFSQMQDPVAALIGQHKVAADGICEMLSAQWIIENAHGRSFSAWIQSGGLSIDPSKIRLLMQLFVLGNTKAPEQMIDPGKGRMNARGVTDTDRTNQTVGNYKGVETFQTKATYNYFKSHGIGLVDERRAFEVWRSGEKGGGEKIKHGLADAICEGYSGTPNYRAIGMWGHGGGHATAAWMGTSIHFFDPNFGEFRFGSKESFKKWFVDSFYPKSFYTTLLGNSWQIFRYAKT